MKKLVIIFTVLISMSVKTNAQIPNNGFEIWEDYSDPDNPNDVYQKPDNWVGLLPNSFLIYSYSIEKNLDSFPAGTGLYSMIIKSDIANDVNGAAFSWDALPPSISWQNIPPAFPINYRPTSLLLYYKYLPENGDSMRVACSFYKDGVVIGGFDYNSPQMVQSWTLLEIPISFSTSDIPDSATIILTTFYIAQHNGSKLYIDNLSFDTSITSVNKSISGDMPNIFTLMQNYPNPFNPSTSIQFGLPEANHVSLVIYDVRGREVRSLADETLESGYHTITWDSKNNSGLLVPGGIYFYRVKVGEEIFVKKLTLVR